MPLRRIATAVAAATALTPIAHAQSSGRVADGITRYHFDAANASGFISTPAIVDDWPFVGAVDAATPAPAWGTAGANTVMTFSVPAEASVYGLGSAPGPLERTGRRTVMWNTDAFAWNDSSESLYQSHPWFMVVREDGSAYGVFVDTSFRAEFRVELGRVYIEAEGPRPPVWVLEPTDPAVPDPQEIVMRLAELTGTPFMPPLWSVGYHQSRYSYFPDSQVFGVANEFRTRTIPADVIWMDIDYMDGYKSFTFSPFAFPNPAGLDSALDAIDFRTVAIIDPHIKVENGYHVYDSGQVNNVWTLDRFGNDFIAPVWPGDCKFPDFTRADVRTWWAGLYPAFMSVGIDGIWNDMNEPAAFIPERTMPLDNIHQGDTDLGGTDTHRRYHNLYAMLEAQGSRQGILQSNPGLRPFLLTRAGFLGVKRDAAMWTGDNVANWYHLDVSINQALSMGLSGQPFSGPDIGAFSGDVSPELFARWMGVGAMLPFARGHTGPGQFKEPWSFGAATEQTCRLAINRRYRLMRHYYGRFRESHDNGMPVLRPLFFAEPTNPAVRSWDDAFLVGDGLVVAAATDPGATPLRPPLLGAMHRFGFAESNALGAASDICADDLPALYLRAGHIVPSGPVIQSTREMNATDLTLLVALDGNGEATGELYEDDGDGWGFQTGDYLRSVYSATTVGNQVTVQRTLSEGAWPRPARDIHVRLLLGDDFEITATAPDDGAAIVLALPDATAYPEPGSFTCGGAPIDRDAIDGLRLADGTANRAPRAEQVNPTLLGDNLNEMNTMLLFDEGDALRLALPGNLGVGDGRRLALFIDAVPGGQTSVDTSNINPPPDGLRDLTGIGFDTGFEPELLIYANIVGNGQFYTDRVDLQTSGGASKTYAGTNFVGAGSGVLSGGDSGGLQLAIDNRNRSGVSSSSASAAAFADEGVEMLLPRSLLGLPATGVANVKLFAMITEFDGLLTGQMLPPSSTPNTLESGTDLGTVPGRQYTSFTLGTVADLTTLNTNPGDDAYGQPDGAVDGSDLSFFVENWLGSTALADLTTTNTNPGDAGYGRSDGSVDGADLAFFVEAWLAAGS